LFGKPISQVTPADLQSVLFNKAPEGRHLEFKEAVPVSKEDSERQRKEGVPVPFDRKVADGKGIADHGRNELMEELAAFANADGGVIALATAPLRHAHLIFDPQSGPLAPLD
jgi:hypothetical protein